MTGLEFLAKAHRQHVLWPPVHAALDVLLRRRSAGGEPYELIWRAIHLWECVETCLAEAAIARLITLRAPAHALLSLREKCYGRSWNEAEATLERSLGAFAGSQDRWIEILEYCAKIDPNGSEFLTELRSFLDSALCENSGHEYGNLNVDGLYRTWRRACDVPSGLPEGDVPVRSAMKVINVFRNRFAHVPFPYDPILPLANELLSLTNRLFQIAGTSGVLSGAIRRGGTFLQGSNSNESVDAVTFDLIEFAIGVSKGKAREAWDAAPFVYVDRMMRVYLVTRMKDEEGLWEYTRYLAEADAIYVSHGAVPSTFAIPTEVEYRGRETDAQLEPALDAPQPEAVPASAAPGTTDQALEALRRRDFRAAITFFELLTAQRPAYHVGWLRLGFACRELAAELISQDPQGPNVEASELLKKSLEALARAKGHVAPEYRAEAAYQASKSWYRLWRLNRSAEAFSNAADEALSATAGRADSKYDSWVEYLSNIADVNDRFLQAVSAPLSGGTADFG